MANLVTLEETKDFLSIKPANTDNDGRLANIITYTSTLVSSYCGREFLANNYVEYFDGGISSVFVDNPPINRIDEVAQYTGSEYEVLGSPGSQGQPIVVQGASHSFTTEGTPQLKTRVKRFGRSSLRLDGSSSLLASSNEDWDFGVEPFTLEAYARFDELSGTQTIFSSGTATDYWVLEVDFDTNGLQFRVVDSGSEVANTSQGSASGYTVHTFNHYALVRDSSTFTIYRDGTELANTSASISIPNYDTGVYLGRGISGNYLTGYLDDVEISLIAKTISNVDYPNGVTEDTALLCRFDGSNNGTSFIDVSRLVNQYTFDAITGEVSFNTGHGGGTPRLGFFRPLQFDNFPQNVRVVYNGGYTAAPNDLKMAVLELIKVVYKGKSGTQEMRLQGENIQQHKLSVDEFPPHVRRILNLYRIVT